MNRSSLCIFVCLLCLCVVLVAEQSEPSDMHALIQELNQALAAKDLPRYLSFFSENIREYEQFRIQSLFDDFKMDSGLIYLASQQERPAGGYTLYIRLFFQNTTSVILDLWRMAVISVAGHWTVVEKQLVGDPKTLFKLSLPSERVERVRSLTVEHEDIRISFEDALCFYDNIPEFETALIVIGKGELEFSPSHPRERYQLELFFKQKTLLDKLEYAYLRFSPSFFRENISIVKETEKPFSLAESELNEAYSIFMRHYSRSFTVRNSLDGALLSVTPQGDEAVFEFKGKKAGDSTYVYSPFTNDEINFYQWKEDRLISLYSPPLRETDKRLFISFGQKYDVLSYEIDIDFKPEQFLFAGKARIVVEAKIGQLDSLKFHLNPALQVLRVTDVDKHELYYTEDKLRKSLYIYFLRPPARGNTTKVEVYYRGTIEPPALISDVVSVRPGQTYRSSQIRYDALLYSRSSIWYPSPDNVDYFNARLKFITPPSYQVIANGTLEEKYYLENLEDVEDVGKLGNVVHVYQTQHPVKYLSFVAGHLEKKREAMLPIPIQYYRSSQTYAEKWDIFEGAQEMLQFYQGLFGSYPYEKLCLVRRLWVTAGGHSPASFVVLNDLPESMGVAMRPSSNSAVDLSRWKEYFLAHEIAHQWWGQGLAWESYSDQWLSEGMAQFAAIQFLKEKYGEKVYSQILEKFSRGIQRKSRWGGITLGSRISYFDFDAYQTIVYNKTALVLNMLQDILGKDVFYAGLKRFYSRFRYRAANSRVFFQAFRDLTSRDLTPFFEMWFNSHLLPMVTVTHSLHEEADGYLLKFNVTQSQNEFIFPLWIEWQEQGRKVRKQIIVDERAVNYEIRTSQKPEKIKINPEAAVPGKFRFK